MTLSYRKISRWGIGILLLSVVARTLFVMVQTSALAGAMTDVGASPAEERWSDVLIPFRTVSRRSYERVFPSGGLALVVGVPGLFGDSPFRWPLTWGRFSRPVLVATKGGRLGIGRDAAEWDHRPEAAMDVWSGGGTIGFDIRNGELRVAETDGSLIAWLREFDLSGAVSHRDRLRTDDPGITISLRDVRSEIWTLDAARAKVYLGRSSATVSDLEIDVFPGVHVSGTGTVELDGGRRWSASLAGDIDVEALLDWITNGPNRGFVGPPREVSDRVAAGVPGKVELLIEGSLNDTDVAGGGTIQMRPAELLSSPTARTMLSLFGLREPTSLPDVISIGLTFRSGRVELKPNVIDLGVAELCLGGNIDVSTKPASRIWSILRVEALLSELSQRFRASPELLLPLQAGPRVFLIPFLVSTRDGEATPYFNPDLRTPAQSFGEKSPFGTVVKSCWP